MSYGSTPTKSPGAHQGMPPLPPPNATKETAKSARYRLNPNAKPFIPRNPGAPTSTPSAHQSRKTYAAVASLTTDIHRASLAPVPANRGKRQPPPAVERDASEDFPELKSKGSPDTPTSISSAHRPQKTYAAVAACTTDTHWVPPAPKPASKGKKQQPPANQPLKTRAANVSRTTDTHRTPSSRIPANRGKKQLPRGVEQEAFEELKSKHFSKAEGLFRHLFQQYGLNNDDAPGITIGLARSLQGQTREKQMEACSLLERLREGGQFTPGGASTIPDLDLTLSRCKQMLGLYSEAETLLLLLSNKQSVPHKKPLCKPTGRYNIDLALVRLWEEMDKNQLAEGLLLAMSGKNSSTNEGTLCQATGFHDLDLALVRLLQRAGKYRQAERLLLDMSGKHPGDIEDTLCTATGQYDSDITLALLWEEMGNHQRAGRLLLDMRGKKKHANEAILCKPCGRHDLDLTMARHWQAVGEYQWTERLLLAMSGKDPDADEDLCQPCGHHDLDMALARHWQVMGEYQWAERLLLAMSGKDPDADEDLCQPCGRHDLDMALARLWEMMGEYQWAERLLLAMSGKDPDADEDLCQPCGRDGLDRTLALLWQVMDKNQWAEQLLLAMSGKDPLADEKTLCQPTGRQVLDLTLARHWEMVDKYGQAKKLLEKCCEFYQSNECKEALLCLLSGQPEFMERVAKSPESAVTLRATSIHFYTIACKQITSDDLKSGMDNLNKALQAVELALKQFPPSAKAFAQKAHCRRMMGAPEQEWRSLFNKAQALDPNRMLKAKSDLWRDIEAAALKKVQGLFLRKDQTLHF